MRGALLIATILCATLAGAAQQDTLRVRFSPVLAQQHLEAGARYALPDGYDSVTIETFRFYVSNIALSNDGSLIHQFPASHHLLDLEGKMELLLPIEPSLEFDAIQFNVGIDSLTNVSGAMGGDLDPIHGMYWAWQSGYINFKLEGTSEKCNTRNRQFQFHIGGYLSPFSSIQEVSLPMSKQTDLEVMIDLDLFFQQVDLSSLHTVMSPSQQAVKLAKLYQSIFYVQP